MHPLLLAILAGAGFIAAYFTYGRWLGQRVFGLSVGNTVPSIARRDDNDFIPTKKSVVFGHHFTSIAGTGPIVGPAIAILWGWVPAVLWIIFGSIFIGAVHDFGSLVVSLRNGGRTVGDIAGSVINRRTRLLFLCVLFLCLLIVIAIFGLVIAAVFRAYPQSIFPCLVQIPLAVIIGVWLHRRGVDLLIPSLIALVLMYVTTFFGDVGVLHWFNQTLAAWPMWAWVGALLAYGFAASVLPVWSLLQPRDYINSLQLLTALGLIVLGLFVATFIGGAPTLPTDATTVGTTAEVNAASQTIEPSVTPASRPQLAMVAPAWNLHPPGAPPVWPFLFITIACGACSGFHCLVSSGTSSKQLRCETDARFVGYGAMLTEGFLAVLVIIACGAGLGLGVESHSPLSAGTTLYGVDAFADRYASWQSADGLGAKVGAFVSGAGNLVAAVGLPRSWATALMAVLVASFAGTTLDTAVRLQRYVIEELLTTLTRSQTGRSVAPSDNITSTEFLNTEPNGTVKTGDSSIKINGWLMYISTAIAVTTGGLLAAIPASGQWNLSNVGTGGLILWPLFGASNQLLAGLAFTVILFYLRRRRNVVYFLLPPMLFMLIMPAWAMIGELPGWWNNGRYVLASIGTLCLLLEAWMVLEAALLFPHVYGKAAATETYPILNT